MADKVWKQVERSIASLIGGKRIPITGRQRGDVPDIEHRSLSVEIKSRKRTPGETFAREALDQAKKSVQSDRAGEIPVAIFHTKGKRHSDDLVVMTLGDFIEGFLDNDGQAQKLKTIWRGLDSEEDGLREAASKNILSRDE